MHAQLKTSERAVWETRGDVINKYYSWYIHFLKRVNLGTKLCGSRTYASCSTFCCCWDFILVPCVRFQFFLSSLSLCVTHTHTHTHTHTLLNKCFTGLILSKVSCHILLMFFGIFGYLFVFKKGYKLGKVLDLKCTLWNISFKKKKQCPYSEFN